MLGRSICCDELLRVREPYNLPAHATLTLRSSTETDFEKNITTVFAVFLQFLFPFLILLKLLEWTSLCGRITLASNDVQSLQRLKSHSSLTYCMGCNAGMTE